MLHSDEIIVAAGRPVQPDALIEFRVREVQQEPITAVLEFKSRLTPLIFEGTIHQVLGISNSLCASVQYGDVYPMVGAPYISESVQNRCKELGIGYVDLNGTLLLARNNIYMDVVRPATLPTEGSRTCDHSDPYRRAKQVTMNRQTAFWDSSALVPLLVHEAASRRAHAELRKFLPVVWWGTPVEIHSAISREHRLGQLSNREKQKALAQLEILLRGAKEILPQGS